LGFSEAGVAISWKKGDLETLVAASTALESIPKTHDEQVKEILASGWVTGESSKELATLIRKSVKPVNNTALPPNYRKSVVRVLVKRALQAIGCE